MAYSRKAGAMMIQFGNSLSACRIIAGYPDAVETAEKLGLGPQAYRKYERGESMPPPDTLEEISDRVGKTLDFLILSRPEIQL